MQSGSSPAMPAKTTSGRWLAENGPRELEALLCSVVYHPSAPILIADDDGAYCEASAGAEKLLGIPRDQIIGHKLKDFTQPSFKPQVSQIWQAFLQNGEQEGVLPLRNPDGSVRHVAFVARKSILPVRHVIALHDVASPAENPIAAIPTWVRDYALYLMDPEGRVAAWYSGASRIYGYDSDAIVLRDSSVLYTDTDIARNCLAGELQRATLEGHLANEGWQQRKDGTRFWANTITMALRENGGELQGFARIVRDFTERHERDERLLATRTRAKLAPAESSHAGVVSGGFNRIPEANDTFLHLIGYTREDLASGKLIWSELTPPEYAPLDELAHEEGLRYGACTPFEKELICKDGSRVRVLVTTAVLKLAPFQWISFITDLREKDRLESVDADPVSTGHQFEEMIGDSPPLRRVMSQVEVVAPTDATVLILGETGTGKELVARALHRLSPRWKMPFISLNCAAIPTGLLESELFGYERGAFTGALGQKIGRFEMAHRGTLFLDEVGDIPYDLQPKLLRALQEKSFERLGGTRTIPIDVRLIAATNRNLAQMMGEKLFRSDLYYRLKVFPIATPPLREHSEDIPLLVRHFTKKYAAKMDRKIERIPADTMKALVAWTWPGNVRELENFIERSVILSNGATLNSPLTELRDENASEEGTSLLEDIEREHILRIFRETGGVISATATRLGIPRTTLNAMMRKLGISRDDL